MASPTLWHEVPTYMLTLRPGPLLHVAEPTCGSSSHATRIALAWFREHMPAVEHVLLIALDGRNRVCGLVEVSRGGAHGSALAASDVFRPALALNASAIVLAHNHPSDDPTPSAEDLVMTGALREAGAMIGLPLLDHIVIAVRSGFSVSIFETMEI
jgi:DNA repair protein RadC